MPSQAEGSVLPTSGALLPVEIWERIMMHLDPRVMDKMALVSRKHREITQSSFFRARFFVSGSMPCQALYRASCRPKLFTPEVIKCMLAQGAILSRYFAQSLLQRLTANYRLRGNSRWGAGVGSYAVQAILNEALRLFGETFKFTSHATDGLNVKAWADARSATMTDEIREIFVDGKFSIFSQDDCYFSSLYPLSIAIAKHPELLKIMLDNGFEYSIEDEGRIVKAILDTKEEEDALYTRLDHLLTEYPNWNMTAKETDLTELFRIPYSLPFSPVPLDEATLTLLNENDGVGPIDTSFKVIKRLFDEGRAFGDLLDAVEDYVKKCRQVGWGYSRPLEHAATFRILLKMFPSLQKDHKMFAAVNFVSSFQEKADKATASAITRGHHLLFKLFEDIDLDKDDLISLLSDDRFTYDKLITYAVKEDKVEQLKQVDKRDFLKDILKSCLFLPMSGHKLEEIEVAYREVAGMQLGTIRTWTLKRATKANAMLSHDLSEALMEWEFDLDVLKPDRRSAVDHKLRTPIGWMVKGVFVRSQMSYHSVYTAIPDIHGLFPQVGRPRYSNDTVELSFAAIPSQLEEEEEGRKKGKGKEKMRRSSRGSQDKEEQKEENPGWRLLGYLNEVMVAEEASDGVPGDNSPVSTTEEEDAIMADDSGVAMVDDEEDSQKETEDITDNASNAQTEEETIHSTTTSSTTKNGRPLVGKIGNYATYTMGVLRSHCRSCFEGARSNCCGSAFPFDVKAKELATTMQTYLAPTSSALRDIVLAHALVNGNEELAKKLMEGEWEKGGSDEGKGDQTKTKLTTLAKTRLGAPDQPVSPTLAHLRILQAVERKPVPIFIQMIVKGAPFKRGYVKSSLACRTKEREWQQRDEWSEKKGKRDDRSMTSLFEEKYRLEELDKEMKRKQRKQKNGSDPFDPSDCGGAGGTGAVLVAAPPTAAETSKSSTRAHLARSARKPVQYNEYLSLSTDEEEEEDQGQEQKPSRLQSMGKKKKNKVQEKKSVAMSGILDDGSELSDLSEEGGVNWVTISSGDGDEDEDAETDGECEEEDEEEKDGDGEERDMYGVKEEIIFKVKIKYENGQEEEIELIELKRRCHSLSLWLDHIQLLLWFERRKERLAKEKAAKARDARQRYDRMYKSAFSKSMSELIKTMEPMVSMMQSSLVAALIQRKEMIAQERIKEKENAKKRKRNEKKKIVKVKEEKVGNEDWQARETNLNEKGGSTKKRAKKNGEGSKASSSSRSSRSSQKKKSVLSTAE